MTTPSIADVKAAAENIAASGAEYLSDPTSRDASTLSRFALSVINAPGLSAERMAEIQRKEQAATPGPWRNTCGIVASDATEYKCAITLSVIDNVNGEFIADARQSVHELLTEVLRLRAEKAAAPVYPDCVAVRKLWVYCFDPVEAAKRIGLTMNDVIEYGTDASRRYLWYIKIKATGQRANALQHDLNQEFPEGAVPWEGTVE
jgi:hypothetical protein